MNIDEDWEGFLFVGGGGLISVRNHDVKNQGGKFVHVPFGEVWCWRDGHKFIGIVTWGGGIWAITPIEIEL